MSFEILLKKVGVCGRYQLSVLALMMVCKMFPAIITVMSVLSQGKMDFTCKLPTNASSSNSVIVSADPEECQIIFNNTVTREIIKQDCTEWTFSTKQYTSTIRSKYNLVCGRASMVNNANTLYFVGFLFGCTGYGQLSDKIGRKKSIIIAVIHMSLMSIAAAVSPVYWLYATLRLITGIGTGGLLVCLFTMTTEVTNSKFRPRFLMNVQNGWAVGVCLLALLGYFVRHQLYLQLILGGSVSILLIVQLFVFESPRWLYCTSRLDEAERVFRSIAKRNKRTLEDDFSRLVRETQLLEIKSDDNATPEKTDEKVEQVTIFHVFRYSKLRLVTFIVWYNWFVVSLGYFAVLFMCEELPGSVYTNLVLASVVEFPARAVGLFLSVKFGRRIALMVSYGFSGTALLIAAFLFRKPNMEAATIGVAFTGQFFFAMAFDLIWMFSAEIFPTVVRNVSVGVGSTWARVAGMLAPQIQRLAHVWTPLPFLIIGTMPLLASIMDFFLPETAGVVLTETLEESEHFIKHNGKVPWEKENSSLKENIDNKNEA